VWVLYSGADSGGGGFIAQDAAATMEQIRDGMSGNLCRCGAYAHIFRAVERAAKSRKAGS